MKTLLTITMFLFMTGCETAQQVLSGMNTGPGGLTSPEIAAGLKKKRRTMQPLRYSCRKKPKRWKAPSEA